MNKAQTGAMSEYIKEWSGYNIEPEYLGEVNGSISFYMTLTPFNQMESHELDRDQYHETLSIAADGTINRR
jgi:hypothetical protein